MQVGRSGRRHPPHCDYDPSGNLRNHQGSAALPVGGKVATETLPHRLHCSRWPAASRGFAAKEMARLLTAETQVLYNFKSNDSFRKHSSLSHSVSRKPITACCWLELTADTGGGGGGTGQGAGKSSGWQWRGGGWGRGIAGADSGVGVGKEQGGDREELWLTVERGRQELWLTVERGRQELWLTVERGRQELWLTVEWRRAKSREELWLTVDRVGKRLGGKCSVETMLH